MVKNVIIMGVGSYHPEKVLYNDYYIDHFKKFGTEAHAIGMMEKMGRNRRTLASEEETSITMSVEAAKNALAKANLSALDIDAIISVSDTPEYLTPCCALIIKNSLEAKNVTNVFDMNNDCIGMLTAIDVASRYLKTDIKYKRILVVGSMNMTPFSREDDLVTYQGISDGAAAIILEVVEEEEERGFLGSRVFTDDSYNKNIRFPSCGLSKITDEKTSNYDRRLRWDPFDFSFLSDEWSKLMTTHLADHYLTPKDVSHYFISQFSKHDLYETLAKLGVDRSKAIFNGDKYGYTGCASPIIALDDMLSIDDFKANDILVFCSVAAGYTMASLIYKW
ncbi:3-oxoacyl-[acyl-carrier-protein] synthase III C-terminal domain-containing protein [Clostridium sp. C8-1-8]|uniref:3-oxoacyl-[acyl-carrier-protein] synthase III C-terminal domain-containing protein n=1 Tax=Clostridium sp. C8-1-8 TaxID=2698831 RepID=UPI0013703AB8|nr:3-oxoacyl-[acyl-carrier-protein] synthase III C-terminal domain-containing protein [Clostridium sp. C8-1-8]